MLFISRNLEQRESMLTILIHTVAEIIYLNCLSHSMQ